MSETGPAKSRMSRGMRLIFGLSLALNLLIVGAIAGALLRHGGPPDRSAAPPGGVGRLLYGELPKEDRRALRRQMRGVLDRGVLRDVRIHNELDATLRAEVFDAEAARALLDRQANALRTGQRAMLDGWLGIVADMDQAERQAYADRVSEAIKLSRRGGFEGPGGKPQKP